MKDRIKRIRMESNLTQQAFADKIGVKRNTVALYESGDCGVSDAVIKLICKAYNVNEEWLRTGNGEMYVPIDDEVAAIVSNLLEESNPTYDLVLKIVRTYSQLNDKDRAVIDNFINTLLKGQE